MLKNVISHLVVVKCDILRIKMAFSKKVLDIQSTPSISKSKGPVLSVRYNRISI